MRILRTYSLLQWFDGYMHLGLYNMHIQNALTRATLGFLEHGLLLLDCSSTFLHPLRKLLQVSPLLSAISWFTNALALHTGLLFLPAPRKVFGSSSKIQAQHLEGASKNARMALKGMLPRAPQLNQKSFFLPVLAHTTAGSRNRYIYKLWKKSKGVLLKMKSEMWELWQ